MSGKLALAVVVGLVLGLAVPALLRPQQAQAQKDETGQKHKWEYRVEYFAVGQTERNLRDAAKRFSVEFNKLAADGWEFVNPTQIGAGPTAAYLLFKRPRK